MAKRRALHIDLMDLGRLITRSNPGTQKVTCKFVLIARSDELCFVFGPVRQYPYHAHLIDAYCRRNDIPSTWIKKPDVVEVYDNDCVIRGGGWMELDPAQHNMKVYGYSTAYGRFDADDLNRILDESPTFSKYTVHVES